MFNFILKCYPKMHQKPLHLFLFPSEISFWELHKHLQHDEEFTQFTFYCIVCSVRVIYVHFKNETLPKQSSRPENSSQLSLLSYMLMYNVEWQWTWIMPFWIKLVQSYHLFSEHIIPRMHFTENNWGYEPNPECYNLSALWFVGSCFLCDRMPSHPYFPAFNAC